MKILLFLKEKLTQLRLLIFDYNTLGGANKRSPQWRRVRQEYLRKNPTCAATGTKKKCEIHHKKPFHLYPELELEESNLITLTRKNGIHLVIGHLGNFRSYNVSVEKDAKLLLNKFKNRP